MNLLTSSRGAAPWLLAAALMAAGLATPPAAQAALVVTSANRFVAVDTSLTPGQQTSSFATSGAFVASEGVAPGGSRATAGQESGILPLAFVGSGFGSIAMGDATGQAESLFDVSFTLTSAYLYSGTAAFEVSGNAFTTAFFALQDGGGRDIVLSTAFDQQPPFDGTLAAGDYHLLVRASADSIDPNESGFASFSFNLNFVPVDSPPGAVPEPAGLALAALAVLALRGTRRRR